MMPRPGPNQRPDLDGAPTAPRVTLPRRKYITQVPGARSKFSLRVLCWVGLMASFACSYRYLFIADIWKVSISEGIKVVKPCSSLSAPKAHWTGEYPPVLKPLSCEKNDREKQDANVKSGWSSGNFLAKRLMSRIRFSRSAVSQRNSP